MKIANPMLSDTPPASRGAVLYARVSSKEQEKEGFSIPAQQKLLQAYAIEHGFTVVSEFIDVETAKQSGRPQFNGMLAFLKENPEVRIVLVEKTDRLYRNFRDYVTIDELDLEIHLVKEGEVLSKDSRSHQKLIHGIKLLMAKNYCDNLSEETRKGMTEKVAQGGYPHFAPVGYRNDKATRGIVTHPQEAAFIRRLFNWYATGEVSLAELRKRCIAQGFKGGRGGKLISKSKVELILKNPFYCGLFRWKGTLYEGSHEKVVSKELFDQVQAAFASHRRKSGKYRVHEFAFGGLITCGTCGCAITAEFHRSGRYAYYHCTNYHGKCTEGWLREEVLEAQFGDVVRAISLDQETVGQVKLALRQSLSDQTVFHQESIASLSRQLEQVKLRMNRSYEDRLEGRISEEFWKERSQAWQHDKARISGELARHLEADDRYMDAGVKILELSGRAYESYSRRDPSRRRQLLGFLLSTCTLSKGRITPAYKQPFDLIALMASRAPHELALQEAGLPNSEDWGG